MVRRSMTGTSPDPIDPHQTDTGTLFLLAITGSMGCGKSAVTRALADRGAKLLDADLEARAVLTPGSSGWFAVLEQFGPEILIGYDPKKRVLSPSELSTTEIDRRALGEKVFYDPKARATLEAIVHPRIFQRHALALRQWQKAAPPHATTIVAAEIPLLFETSSDKRFDMTVAVLCGEQQWPRIQERTGMSTHTKQAIIRQQLPESEKQRRAHWSIDNGGKWEETERQIDHLLSHINILSNDTKLRAWPTAWQE